MASVRHRPTTDSPVGRTTTSGPAVTTVASRSTAGRHLAWLAGGMVMAFLVPFVLADQLDLQRDVYYGLYIAAVVGLFVAWARDTGQSLREMCARRWKWAAGLGLVFAGVSVLIAL
jgi:predicted lipid-binding transport protein (Tim44 family)